MTIERIVFPDKRKVIVESVQLRTKLKPTELLLENKKSLVSAGTELSIYLGTHTGLKDPKNKWAKYPFYPGYAAAGVVKTVGQDVADIKVGDRVVCESRHETLTIVDLSSNDVLPIPEEVTFTQASFFHLGSVALNGIRKAKISLGDSVVIFGQGLVGQLALQLARLSGASPIIAIDYIPERLEISKQNGAEFIFNPTGSDLKKEIDKITNARGAQIVIEATGSPEVIPQTFKLTGEEGKVILLGSTRGSIEVDFYTEVHRRGISIIGAHESTSPEVETTLNPWTRLNNQRHILKLIKKNFLQVDSLVTHEFQLNEAKQAYEGLIHKEDEFLGVVFSY